MIDIIIVSTFGSPWAQKQELIPGDPATGPPYYSGGAENGDQLTNERLSELLSPNCPIELARNIALLSKFESSVINLN